MSDPSEINKESNENSGGRGGKRPGAGRPRGRPKGAKNLKTLELQAAARLYADDALEALKFVATKSKSHSARVMAAVAILDRGFGKPRQSLEVSTPAGGGVLAVPVPVDAAQWAAGAAAQQAGLLARPALAPPLPS